MCSSYYCTFFHHSMQPTHFQSIFMLVMHLFALFFHRRNEYNTLLFRFDIHRDVHITWCANWNKYRVLSKKRIGIAWFDVALSIEGLTLWNEKIQCGKFVWLHEWKMHPIERELTVVWQPNVDIETIYTRIKNILKRRWECSISHFISQLSREIHTKNKVVFF